MGYSSDFKSFKVLIFICYALQISTAKLFTTIDGSTLKVAEHFRGNLLQFEVPGSSRSMLVEVPCSNTVPVNDTS